MRRCEALEPVARRVVIVGEGGGRLLITFTGKGVVFVVASADRFLAAVGLLDPSSGAPLLDELAVGPVLRHAAARRALRWPRHQGVPPLGLAAAHAGHGFCLRWVRRRKLLFRCALLSLCFLVFSCLPDLG